MKDPNCAYCMQGDLVAAFAYPICQMNTGYLYLFKEQSKKGRVILAHNKHVSELIELTDQERNDFLLMLRLPPGPSIKCLPRIRSITAHTGIPAATFISISSLNMKAAMSGAARSR